MLPADNGRINQIKKENFGINSADSVAAFLLLKQNNISYIDNQLEYYSSYSVPGANCGDVYANVFAIQFLNGLPML